MTRYLLCLLLILLFSCGGDTTSGYPKSFSVESGKPKFKKGDCLAFKMDSLHYGVGIVHDFSKDEGGKWCGLLLTDYESGQRPEMDSMTSRRCFGRKVESSLNSKGYETTLDAEYVHDSLLANNFFIIGNLPLKKGIMIGAHGASAKMNGFVRAFKYGSQRRLQPPDDYRDHLRKSDNFRPDEYFFLNEFVEKQN